MFTKDDLQDLTVEELLQMNETIVNLIKEKRSNIIIDSRIKVGCTVEVEIGKRVAGFPAIQKFVVTKIKKTKAVCRVAFEDKLYDIPLNRMKFINEKAIDKC